MAEQRFAKYHGTGNDFVLIEDLDDRLELTPEVVKAVCDRRFGVGADGVIRITRDPVADFFMDYRNADGSIAEMCGNGIRCLGKLVHDRGFTTETELKVATRAGMRTLRLHLDDVTGVATGVTVAMGPARFKRSEIPMRGPAWETFLEQPFELGEETFTASAVSMGNPHLVLFLDAEQPATDVERVGPRLEHHELFPELANVEFVLPDEEPDQFVVRVWERGSGQTMACGTGACAVAVAANEAGRSGPSVAIRFPGGTVQVERRADGEVFLTGPAVHVFDGEMTFDVA